ncbi:hypothetical protein ASPWEDRAFT_52225 [Aspergillus wentii DTO 134E9]|uniref:PRISE-like Rossmann-fold domain-containing protein n=1 Tax=Aspergillus wentii DTO 134E9 TaxID=1073089 RepID=A0A1L9RG32_ASPWE|nr:uncharacterized protein ASPWEDRAFT_52225 [Aspergillus wentii DTO 134E9]KAI9925587.1 hypothetical protein MW887_005969 [Aspergillus wentii]OJJ33828.1 hypothetical protein ASPWEDRAFT_52225 [Aspergillus wentii DTO 134E9]
MATQGRHALIFGASGISGWSLMKQCLSYPTPSTFARITGLSNRPVDKKNLFLPDDARLNIVSGIDLTASTETVVTELRKKVPSVEDVDVVFFSAYIQTNDHDSLLRVNTALLTTAVQAITAVSKKVSSIVLQTGGKAYGVEFPDKIAITPPLHEDLPRIPEPYRSKIFYYAQYDVLAKMSQEPGCTWTFSEIRPDGIVGFVPGSNAMNMAQGIALYLSLYREVYGAGAKVPFPGEKHGYHARHMDTFQDLLSRLEIYVAVNRQKCGNGSVFNAADGEVITWADVWPGICAYFGLEGVEPEEKPIDKESMERFVKGHLKEWQGLVEKHGLKTGRLERQNWGHTRFMLVDFDFHRDFSMEKARAVGFNETIDTVLGYKVAFDRMVEARVIPRVA